MQLSRMHVTRYSSQLVLEPLFLSLRLCLLYLKVWLLLPIIAMPGNARRLTAILLDSVRFAAPKAGQEGLRSVVLDSHLMLRIMVGAKGIPFFSRWWCG